MDARLKSFEEKNVCKDRSAVVRVRREIELLLGERNNSQIYFHTLPKCFQMLTPHMLLIKSFLPITFMWSSYFFPDRSPEIASQLFDHKRGVQEIYVRRSRSWKADRKLAGKRATLWRVVCVRSNLVTRTISRFGARLFLSSLFCNLRPQDTLFVADKKVSAWLI